MPWLPCLQACRREAEGTGVWALQVRRARRAQHAWALEGDVTVWTSHVQSMHAALASGIRATLHFRQLLSPQRITLTALAQSTREKYDPAIAGAFQAPSFARPHRCASSTRPHGHKKQMKRLAPQRKQAYRRARGNTPQRIKCVGGQHL